MEQSIAASGDKEKEGAASIKPSAAAAASARLEDAGIRSSDARTISDSSYSKEVMEYAMQKSVENLKALLDSGVISDAKFSKAKEKLVQTFD